jgi:hypothetical protein
MSQYTASDVLLVGITPSVLDTVISDLLEVKYLEPVQDTGFYPQWCYGIMFGEANRMLLSLAVAPKHGKTSPCNVIFLLDTGAPSVYLSEQV